MSSTPLGAVDSEVTKTDTIPPPGELTFPITEAGEKPINI